MWKLILKTMCLVFLLIVFSSQLIADEATRFQRLLQDKIIHQLRWHGPITGPVAVKGRKILFIAEDFSNGGVRGVAAGVRQAVKKIGWTLDILGYSQTEDNLDKFYSIIIKSRPDGVVIGGSDARFLSNALGRLKAAGIFIVGWHVGPQPGPMLENHVSYNVTTNPVGVSQMAALQSIIETQAKTKAVILTDSRYDIAMEKAKIMENTLRQCKGCEVLGVEDIALSSLPNDMRDQTQRLLATYGDNWTHVLAINDLYFDYLNRYLKEEQASLNLKMISAGDGSTTAFKRIKAGDMQTATVAEPLLLQGWQLVDELNRLFSSEDVSGYVSDAGLVTKYTKISEKNIYDPDVNFREIYQNIWAGQ